MGQSGQFNYLVTNALFPNLLHFKIEYSGYNISPK
jgi:hypothetical protein